MHKWLIMLILISVSLAIGFVACEEDGDDNDDDSGKGGDDDSSSDDDSADDDDFTACAEEGELALESDIGECCSGLIPIDCAEINQEDGECIYADCGDMCTHCGDGNCGAGENYCNCEKDCPNESDK